jgi:hypothetical protein
MRSAVLVALLAACHHPTPQHVAPADTDVDGGVDACAGPSTQPGQISWIITFSNVQLLSAQSNDAAQLALAYFNDPRTFLIVNANNAASAQATLPNATLTVGFADFTNRLQPALTANTIPAGVTAIYYDSEKWSFTPVYEQQDPVTYYAMAANAVHAAGYQFLAVPATDLVKAIEPTYTGTIYPEFLNLGIPGAAATYADVYEMQSQGSQRNLSVFTPFVQNAAAQALAANPSVRVLAGLSTNPSSGTPTAQELYDALMSTLGTAEGYWLNVPAPGPQCPMCMPQRPDLAVALLQMLSQHC